MRRYAPTTIVLAAALSLTVVIFQGQQTDADSRVVSMRTLNVRDILYLMTSGSSNSMALVRNDGVVLIDAGLPGWERPMRDALFAVSDQPVTTIVNTNADAGRVAGNIGFPNAARIVAHRNAKAAMLKMEAFQGSNAKFLPNQTVTDQMSLLDGLDRIDLYYFGPAHTNGDLIVVFPEKHTAYLGDLFPAKAAPVIDFANGGSGVAFPQTLARAVAEIHGVTRVITGQDLGVATPRNRAPLEGSEIFSNPQTMTWADFREYAEFNRDFLAAVQEAIKAGKNSDEAEASLNLPHKYEKYNLQRARANIQGIYQELKK
jgi:glyoxylase-like metal-dependent hydrolase (beta-lactamase superfamily II)